MGSEEKIKVFLAEDEFVMREGIKKNINWEANGYSFVGDAKDGELAFPMIQMEKPDILITDIRMPFMDGLELSRLVKKELPETEIIILSGFEEFEYAREGIKIGVAEYLTKPISANDLLTAINKVAAGIRKRRLEKELREKYLKEMQEMVGLEKRDLFRAMVSGESSVSSLIKLAGELNVSITAVNYNLLLLKLYSNKHADREYSGSILTIQDILEEEIGKVGGISFDRSPDGKAYLFMGDSELIVKSKLNAFECKVRSILEEYPNVQFYGAEGKIVGRISEIADSYNVAIKAFAYRFFDDYGKFMNEDDILESDNIVMDDFSVTEIDPKHVKSKEFENFLMTGTEDDAQFFIDAYFEKIGESAIKSGMFRQYISMNVYFTVAEFVESLGMSKNTVESFNAVSEIFKSVEDTKKYLIRIVKEAINIRERLANNKYDTIVNEVYKYVDDNYAMEDLSLNQIASVVNFSPSHLSMVFSQETGITLIKYITDVRMNKAKELLKCTSKRSSEISTLVGYQDPHYFSYLFKKTQGITPTDYREGKQEEG